jgi:hypothetical protein
MLTGGFSSSKSVVTPALHRPYDVIKRFWTKTRHQTVIDQPPSWVTHFLGIVPFPMQLNLGEAMDAGIRERKSPPKARVFLGHRYPQHSKTAMMSGVFSKTSSLSNHSKKNDSGFYANPICGRTCNDQHAAVEFKRSRYRLVLQLLHQLIGSGQHRIPDRAEGWGIGQVTLGEIGHGHLGM